MTEPEPNPTQLNDVDLATLLRVSATEGLHAAWAHHLSALSARREQGLSPTRLNAEQLKTVVAADPALAELAALRVAPDAAHPKGEPWVPDASLALTEVPGVSESNGRPVPCAVAEPFRNWGRTVANTPSVTFFPTTVAGVASAVRWARDQGKRVRAAGYRHTWTDLYSADGDVLVSMLPLPVVDDLPASEPPIDPNDTLQFIKLLEATDSDGGRTRLCTIGAATTNEQFREWCLDPARGNCTWTLPLNVIMVEITMGGSNAPICHGAGRQHRTLSDLVAAVTFVNYNGEIQTVDDPEQLRSAAGAMGLMGVVTEITLRLDTMTVANLRPEKQRLALTVPPLKGYPVPSEVDLSGVTASELAQAETNFVARCENDYYAEWFWFTLQPECWINTWQNDGAVPDAIDYPSPDETRIQEDQEYLAQLLVQSGVLELLPELWQARLLGSTAMWALPTAPVSTWLIDALHFRRGIQNMRVLDMEFEIPIPERADAPGQPDWSIAQRAWWDAITVVYRYARADAAPMRLTLEMRVMGGSDVTLAPQRGNTWGTCSIEVLTTYLTDPAEWLSFMQEVVDAWSSYTDAAGDPLNLRPHWAKQWQGLTVRGLAITSYLRDVAYANARPRFWADLEAVARAGGYDVADMRALFGNALLDEVLT